MFKRFERQRAWNQVYAFVMHWIHILLELLPGPFRNFCFRLLLKKMGRHVYFDYGIFIKFPGLVSFGDNVAVNRGSSFYPAYNGRHEIVIGSDVIVSPHVQFYAGGHDLLDFKKSVGGRITVGNGVWIGAGSIILPGATIGDRSVIAAGSVVASDIPPNTIASGIPARPMKPRRETDQGS